MCDSKTCPAAVGGLGFLAGLLVAAGLFWINAGESRPAVQLPVQASTAASNESFAIATGQIDQEVEGLFTLDSLTGDLQCRVINPRNAKFLGAFKRNVVGDLGIDQGKKPAYLMVTGTVDFIGARAGGGLQPAQCVVYVVDTNSGKMAAYGLPWNRNTAQQMQPQVGELKLLEGAALRNVRIRD